MIYFIADFGLFNQKSTNVINLKNKLMYLTHSQDILVLGGDHYYNDGINNEEQLEILHKFFIDLPCRITGVLGNHDYYGIIKYQTESSVLNITDWINIVEVDNIILILINTPILCEYYCAQVDMFTRNHQECISDMQYRYLSQLNELLSTLDSTKCKYILGHYPMFSCGSYGNNVGLQMFILPLILKHNINGYICGHEHNMQVHTFTDRELLDRIEMFNYIILNDNLKQLYTTILTDMNSYTHMHFTHIICGSSLECHYNVKPDKNCKYHNNQNNLILAIDTVTTTCSFIMTI
jgi:predicted phosphohydrolase